MQRCGLIITTRFDSLLQGRQDTRKYPKNKFAVKQHKQCASLCGRLKSSHTPRQLTAKIALADGPGAGWYLAFRPGRNHGRCRWKQGKRREVGAPHCLRIAIWMPGGAVGHSHGCERLQFGSLIILAPDLFGDGFGLGDGRDLGHRNQKITHPSKRCSTSFSHQILPRLTVLLTKRLLGGAITYPM
jgi:hypothetical protein